MDAEMTVSQAAKRWGCTERSVQLLCKQGRIPGARKVSGIWLMPGDSARPGSEQAAPPALHPEQLYGSGTTVRIASAPGEPMPGEQGCTVTEYAILDGITLVFQDIHEEKLDYGSGFPQLPGDLIAIQHCREGRFEGEYPNGECIYMGPGNLSVNLPAWSPVRNSFPLRHYHGLYLAILPGPAAASIRRLEAVLGPMHIDFSILSTRLSEKNRLAFYAVTDEMAHLLGSIYPSNGVFDEGLGRLRVLELLRLLCTGRNLPAAPHPYFPREQVQTVKEIRAYLVAHPDQHIPLPALADRFRISLTGMKACFKGVYGQSIGSYLRAYRMHAGAEQLVSTGKKVIDIAASLGYQNASKFSEAFAACFGMTPREYRKTFCPPGAESGGTG